MYLLGTAPTMYTLPCRIVMMVVTVMMLVAMEMVKEMVILMVIVRPGRVPQRYDVLRQGIHCTAEAASLHFTTFTTF